MSTMLRKLVTVGALGLIAAGGSVLLSSTIASASAPVFNNTNGGGVTQSAPMPPAYTLFTLSQTETITSISTYHWDNGRGTPAPGVIYILVPHSGGRVEAQSQAVGSPGQSGVVNANWTATFNVTLPAGQWQVWDSSPTTWSYDAQSGGAGFAVVSGNPAGAPTTSLPSTIRPCFHNTYFPLEMGPCFGPRGTMIGVGVVGTLPSPLVRVLFVNGSARVTVTGLMGGGLANGSMYTFPAPAQLCLAGRGSSTWQAYGWDANGLANPKYSLYGDEGDFGQFTVTGC